MDRIVAGAGMPRAGKPLPGSACATAMTKLLPCQVKVPQPLIDCGNRSIWNGEKIASLAVTNASAVGKHLVPVHAAASWADSLCRL